VRIGRAIHACATQRKQRRARGARTGTLNGPP
jgi:hypothetical protein